MGFQKIGPYDLSRADLVAASLVISFLIGSTKVRIWGGIYALIGLMGIVVGVASGDGAEVIFGVLLPAFIFVIIPALRSLKRAKGVCLFFEPDGLVAETGEIKTTYKWATIRSFRKVGSRLFIMVSGGSALVVADRMTNPVNMADLIATLARHQS